MGQLVAAGPRYAATGGGLDEATHSKFHPKCVTGDGVADPASNTARKQPLENSFARPRLLRLRPAAKESRIAQTVARRFETTRFRSTVR